MSHKSLKHESVLPNSVLEDLLCAETKSVFDGTLGLGGHAKMAFAAFPNLEKYLATDLDAQHLTAAQANLAEFGDRFEGVQANFSTLGELIAARDLPRPLAILLDLGVCSNHLDDAEKGFSFQVDGPLHMCFDQQSETTCETLINQATEGELSEILKTYGEEPAARKIARRINEYRQHQPINRTGQLTEIVEASVHPKDRKKALTRVFQAFRIATNQELEHLEKALKSSLEVMEPGDRIGVMSYHSLEDRIVKSFFRQHSRPVTAPDNYSLHAEVAPAQLKLITRKPITPTDEELELNPRSRSVKFRIAEKI